VHIRNRTLTDITPKIPRTGGLPKNPKICGSAASRRHIFWESKGFLPEFSQTCPRKTSTSKITSS